MDNIALFVENFFKSIHATVEWKSSILHITNVPPAFEAWSGKKGPYQFVFASEHQTPTTDVLVKGSFLLKSMTSFLDQKGQTSALRLQPRADTSAALLSAVKLKNSMLVHTTKETTYTTIYYFTFASTLSYLNKKEQQLYQIAVHNNQLCTLVLDNFYQLPASTDTLNTNEVKASYELAKQAVKQRIQPYLIKASGELKTKLEKEHTRINDHYTRHIQELKLTAQKLDEQLQQALIESNYPKIAQLQERKKQLEHDKPIEKIAREQAFFLGDEQQKHALSVDTKLVSTTTYQLPQYTCTFQLSDKKKIHRTLQLTTSPLESQPAKFTCESCSLPLTDLWICTSGHLSCLPCLAGCDACRQPICKRCRIQKCQVCGKDLCKNCHTRCHGCLRTLCISHLALDYLTNHKRCTSCLAICQSCNRSTDKHNVIRCDTCTKGFCKPCAAAEFMKGRCKGCRKNL